MNIANKITTSRFVITPLFFLAFYFLVFKGEGSGVGTLGLITMWVLFLVSEISDLVDGYVARKYNMVSDLGKLMDPFADVFFRVTYFVCFASVEWVPWWAVMIILWREYTIMFIRMLLIKEGTALAAKFWGKFKAFCYFLTGFLGMVLLTAPSISQDVTLWAQRGVQLFAVLSALFALLSLFNYMHLFFTREKKA